MTPQAPTVAERLAECSLFRLDHNPSEEEITAVLDRVQERFVDERSEAREKAVQRIREHLTKNLEVSPFLVQRLIQPLAPEEETATPLPIYTPAELQNLPDPEWLVEDLLQERGLITLFGQEGTYKTFTALDLSLCLATGISFHGREVREGPVVYVYAEGAPGLKLRLHAWAKGQRGDPRELPNIYFIPRSVDLVEDSGEELEALIQTIQVRVGDSVSLIVIDTLARCFGTADENETQAMNTFTNRCGELRDEFESSVLVLHHTGWDKAKRERGSRSLRNNFDTSIRCSKSGRSRFKLECKKQKDAPPFDPMELRVDEIQLPEGQSSLVLRSVDSGSAVGLRLDEDSIQALKTLASLAVEGATFTDWMAATPLTESTFKRRRSDLIEGGYVTEPPKESRGFHYQPTQKGYALLDSRRGQNGVNPNSGQEERSNGSGSGSVSTDAVDNPEEWLGFRSGSERFMNPSARSGSGGGAYRAPPEPEAPVSEGETDASAG